VRRNWRLLIRARRGVYSAHTPYVIHPNLSRGPTVRLRYLVEADVSPASGGLKPDVGHGALHPWIFHTRWPWVRASRHLGRRVRGVRESYIPFKPALFTSKPKSPTWKKKKPYESKNEDSYKS
jgi:hypothetical protein